MTNAHPTLRRADVFPPRTGGLGALGEGNVLHLTYNARGALYQLLRAIPENKGGTVLLPGFHCTALVEPVARSRFRPVFYRIRPDLSIDLDDLCSKATSDVALIVVVHFFGFSADLRGVLELRERCDCYVLEDCAHSFLTLDGTHPIGYQGDFSIFSFYKMAPSLFGGGLQINLRHFGFTPSRSKIRAKESAVILKRLAEQLIENSGDNFFQRSFHYLESRRVRRRRASMTENQSARSAFVDDPYLFREDLALAQMPAVCKWILKSSDWHAIRSARRRNYELLGRSLQENALLQKLAPDMPEGVCPWAYPVLLQDRARYEHSLRDLGVPFFTFGEVLHPLLEHGDARTRQDAEYLSRRLLALPVHQNLSGEEVVRYAEEVNRFLAGVGGSLSEQDHLAVAANREGTRTGP
jgi:perosamine synthetase